MGKTNMEHRGFIKDALYLPASLVEDKIDLLDSNYRFKFYNESACAKCPYIEERHTAECEECPNFVSDMKLYGFKRINGKRMIKLPPCNMQKTKRVLNLPDVTLKDLRSNEEFEYPVKFTGKLYKGQKVKGSYTVNQKEIVKKFLKVKTGMISSPPRSGKTQMAAYITCKLGVKTLILADQHEFLKQFYETFAGGSDSRPGSTSIKDEPDKSNFIRFVKSPKDLEDIKHVSIVLCNYQKFIRSKEAMNRLVENLGNRSFVIVDEVDSGAAVAYARVLSKIKPKYRLGVSATIKRKDGRSVFLENFMGPIVARAESKGLKPEIRIVDTKIQFKYPYKTWVYAMKALAQNEQRTKLVLKNMKADMKAGHKSFIIPVDFLAHAINLQNRINDEFGSGTARIFSANCDRKKILEDFDNGKFKVLVAIRKMIKRGVDLSSPTAIYMVVPMSATANTGAPMFYQLACRVATAKEGKRQPIIRIFVDSTMAQSIGCFKSLYWNEIYKYSKGNDTRYLLDDDNKNLAKFLSNSKPNSGFKDVRQFIL
jgi:superfamily II DNA or RNA helicase